MYRPQDLWENCTHIFSSHIWNSCGLNEWQKYLCIHYTLYIIHYTLYIIHYTHLCRAKIKFKCAHLLSISAIFFLCGGSAETAARIVSGVSYNKKLNPKDKRVLLFSKYKAQASKENNLPSLEPKMMYS